MSPEEMRSAGHGDRSAAQDDGAQAAWIDKDIRHARTLPGSFYSDRGIHERLAGIFSRSWLMIGHEEEVRTPGSAFPRTLLPGFVDEPLLLTRDANDRLHCLSNVCTHRGMLVAEGPGHVKNLRCRYHGRRFALDGECLGMPDFEEVAGFPSASDNLPRLPLESWGKLLFTSLEQPKATFEEVMGPVMQRLAGFPVDQARPAPELFKDYTVRANWALYCDNFLESFHVPFVHPGLAKTLDYQLVEIELFEHGSVQAGRASSRDDAFDWPESSYYHGCDIAALYIHVFPNLMLNFYPWGLSLNLVEPLGIDRTRVRFKAYVVDPGRLNTGAGANLDRVEREDEEIVEAVQLGTGSRLYSHGRFSPRQEGAVHHFHRMLASRLDANA